MTAENQCQGCSTGTFADVTGLTSCKTCPSGKSNAGVNNTNCESCPRGRILVTVLPLVCGICTAGFYQPSIHLDASLTCIPCPAGRYVLDKANDDSKHDAQNDCLYCTAGTEFSSSSTGCSTCEAGTYQDQNVQASIKCSACPEGRYVSNKGTTPTLHDHLEDCSRCLQGTEFTSKTTKCVICKAGKYQDDNQATPAVCVQCPSGQHLIDTGMLLPPMKTSFFSHNSPM